MCTLYYFLSSRVIQLTPYFMILLVLILMINRNFKLLNRHSILLLFSLVLLPFCFLYYFFILFLFALLLSCSYHCYLFITIIIYSFIYLFIYSYLLYHLFIYFVVLTCKSTIFEVLSPHKIYYSLYMFIYYILHTFKVCKMKYVNFMKKYMLFIVHCSLFSLCMLLWNKFSLRKRMIFYFTFDF